MTQDHGCDVCDHTGWVCENHEFKPWGGTSGRPDACECGAGSPCACNPDGLTDRVMKEIICQVKPGQNSR
jgi:hypothetical protein